MTDDLQAIRERLAPSFDWSTLIPPYHQPPLPVTEYIASQLAQDATRLLAEVGRLEQRIQELESENATAKQLLKRWWDHWETGGCDLHNMISLRNAIFASRMLKLERSDG